MDTSFLLVLFCIFLFSLFLKRLRSKKVDGAAWPFYGKRVLTDAEQVLYWRLVAALPEFVVLAQVQLSRFLGIRKGNSRIQWLNRVNQKSADFVVCAKDFSIVAVIELDDASHDRPSRQKADHAKTKAITDGGLRLIRWPVNEMPAVELIRGEIYPEEAGAAGVSASKLRVAGGVGAAPLR